MVCTYGLCTIPDDRAAIGEATRVLRPGGRLLLAAHVRSPNRVVHGIQRLLEPSPIASAAIICSAIHSTTAVECSEVIEVERLKAGYVELVAARQPGNA